MSRINDSRTAMLPTPSPTPSPSPQPNFLRVLRTFMAANLAEELEYRANLVASVLGTLFWMGLAVLTAGVFFRQTNELGGWGFWEVAALLGVFNAVAGVVEALLRPNIGRIVQHVRDGTLDLILAKPLDPQLHLSFRRLVIWRGTDVLLGLGLAGYAVMRAGAAPSLESLAAFALTLGAALAIVYAVWLGLMTLSFWFVAVENLEILFDSVYEAARFPVSAYPRAMRFVLVYLIPIAWITTVPASALTGRSGVATAAISLAVAAAALVATRLLWRAALRRYTSAGG
ncbi:MAG TPA: ABC-2 family transporter protein [Longimicrobiales bacterium]